MNTVMLVETYEEKIDHLIYQAAATSQLSKLTHQTSTTYYNGPGMPLENNQVWKLLKVLI